MAKHLMVSGKNFTQVSNKIICSKILNPTERIVLACMIGRTDNWDYSIAGLASILNLSKDSVSRALKGLEKHGYLQRIQVKNKEGKFSKTVYEIYDEPQIEPETIEPDTEKPYPENPVTVKPDTEKPAQRNTYVNYMDSINTDSEDLEEFDVVDNSGRVEEGRLRYVIKDRYSDYAQMYKGTSACEKAVGCMLRALNCFGKTRRKQLNYLSKESFENIFKEIYEVINDEEHQYDSLNNQSAYISSVISNELINLQS